LDGDSGKISAHGILSTHRRHLLVEASASGALVDARDLLAVVPAIDAQARTRRPPVIRASVAACLADRAVSRRGDHHLGLDADAGGGTGQDGECDQRSSSKVAR